MAREAEKTANSWEGVSNKLSNTWSDTVENVANSDAVIALLNTFNELLQVVNKTTEVLGSFGTIGLGVGLVAGVKTGALKQVKELIKDQQVLAAGNGIQLKSWQALGAGISSTTKIMLKWLTTSPVGWAVLAAGAIAGVVGLFDLLTTSTKEAREATLEAIDSSASISSEVESLEGKVKYLNAQIDGLNPITDAEDIENLKEESKELENQLKILQEKERIAKESADKKAQESLGKTQTSRYVSPTGESQTVNGYVQESFDNGVTREEELRNAMNAYDEYHKQKVALEAELANMSYGDKGYKEKEKAIESLNNKMIDARTHANELAKELSDEVVGLSGATEESKNLRNSINGTLSTYTEWTDSVDGATNALNANADSSNNIAKSLEFTKSKMVDTINSMSDGMDVLDDIYADVLDKGSFDFTKLDTKKFSESFSGLEPQYEEFIETVSAFPNDINKCQEAFNKLTSAYIEQKGILSGVSDENKQLTIDMLENMGVANAEEVVMSSLGFSFEDYANAKRECALAGVDLLTATDAEIQQLINEKLVTEETAQALFYYQLQKVLASENGIDTSNDCANLIMLAQNAGVTGDVLKDLIELEQIQRRLESGEIISEGMLSKLMTRADELSASIKSQSSQFQKTAKPIAQYVGAGKSADAMNKNLKNSTDAVTEAMKKEKKALEATKSELEKQKEHYDDVAEAVDWFYDKQIEKQEKLIESLEKENELIEEQIEFYDDALSAIDRYYESQIEELEKRKDTLAGNNKETEIAIELEKRQQELQEARNRKSVSLYEKGKGFVYTTDSAAIKDAEENLADAQRQKEEYDIDAQIDKLKEYQSLWSEITEVKQKAEEDSQMIQLLGAEWEAILLEGRIENITSFKDQYVSLQQQIDNNDSLIASYEEKITYYESLKEEWDNLLKKYEEDTYVQLLIGEFGNDYENELLNGRTSRWEKFADDYYNIQVELKKVTDEIEALSKRMEEYAAKMESAANNAANAIKSLSNLSVPSSSSSWYTGGWSSALKASKKAKGGIISKDDRGNLDFIAKSLGEDHMVALTEGEAVISKENVIKNPEIVNYLLSGKRIDLTSFGNKNNILPNLSIPSYDYSKLGALGNNRQKSTTIEFKGDIILHGVQDVDGFARALKQKLPMVMQRELGR